MHTGAWTEHETNHPTQHKQHSMIDTMNRNKKNKIRTSLLSDYNAPLLGYVINNLLDQDIIIDSIIFNSKIRSKNDLIRHQERTKGTMFPIPLSNYDAHFIPCFFMSNHSSQETIALVKTRQIDLLINAGTTNILKTEITNAPQIGVINCHPGLLPKFRGCTCVEWAVFLDEQVGNTVHFINEKIDGGPIILKEVITFRKQDNYADVRVKVYKYGFALLAEGIKKVIQEGLTPENLTPQPPGRHFGVIQSDKLQNVKEKLEKGLYVFQR